eukprot:scaffold1652_cov177-Alexandrium_tamarense.AAC.5
MAPDGDGASTDDNDNTLQSQSKSDDKIQEKEVSNSSSCQHDNDCNSNMNISIYQRMLQAIQANSLLAMISCAITLSYIYPPLGNEYLQPEITASWLAIIVIFCEFYGFFSGLGMHTKEFTKAFERFRFNLFVQTFNFVIVSGFVLVISRLMLAASLLPLPLADGLVICSCLPQAICLVIVLTKTAGGDEAASIFNSAFSNLVGILLSPVLILCYLGVSSHVEKAEVFLKLSLKVALPLLVGQIVHNFVPHAKEMATNHKTRFKQVQSFAMAFIVFTTFSKLWANGSGTGILDVMLMGAIQTLIICILMLWVWLSLRLFFPEEPKLHATGLFICTSKTMPMGIPLINALYEDDPNLALYTLPLLIWYPLTILVGSFLAPFVLDYVIRQEMKLMESESIDGGGYYEMKISSSEVDGSGVIV